jgi:succinoglycan biosynthesis protein ExoA
LTRLVSIIVPCRNERGHIEAFLAALWRQQLPERLAMQVLVADGSSDDGTRVLLGAHALREPRLQVIDNPARITSAALNLAVAAAQGEVIVRMDVHTVYAEDYVARCVEVLEATGAACVGGAWKPVGSGWPQAAIARAFESGFGSGGAASRRASHEGPVDTVYLGCWRRAELLAIGGFDEALVRNQDDELNLRIVRAGGRVWQSPLIRSSYAPRASFAALFRQFFQYGYWKVAVIRKHRLPAAPRQLVPFALVLVLAGLGLAALRWPAAKWLIGLVLLVYGGAALQQAAVIAPPWRSPRDMLGIAWAFVCMHLGYGLGFGRALIDTLLLRRGPGESATRLTR